MWHVPVSMQGIARESVKGIPHERLNTFLRNRHHLQESRKHLCHDELLVVWIFSSPPLIDFMLLLFLVRCQPGCFLDVGQAHMHPCVTFCGSRPENFATSSSRPSIREHGSTIDVPTVDDGSLSTAI